MTDLRAGNACDKTDAPEKFGIASSDVDQARSFFEDMYYPVAIDVPRDAADFQVRSDVIRLGPLTVGRLQIAGPMGLAAAGLDGYHVTLPLTGSVQAWQAGHAVTADPGRAAVFRPGADVQSRHPVGMVQLDVKIDQSALEEDLEALLGHAIDGAIDLPPAMDVTGGPGRAWSRLVRLAWDDSTDPRGLLHEPLIAEQLRHGILGGLLMSTSHRYHQDLSNPAPCGPPRAIRRVVDAMHDGPERRFCATDLAAIAGMSVRSLQEGFRRYVGLPPMAYLQQVRLDRAHEDLLAEQPHRVTVAAVAHRWGFTHLGRFACAYRSRYGVSPSDTLRAI
jgi:AraC-like DNA-binding protein